MIYLLYIHERENDNMLRIFIYIKENGSVEVLLTDRDVIVRISFQHIELTFKPTVVNMFITTSLYVNGAC